MAFSVQRHYTIDCASEEDLIYLAQERLLQYYDDPYYDKSSLPTTSDDAMVQLMALYDIDPETVKGIVKVVSYRMKELPL